MSKDDEYMWQIGKEHIQPVQTLQIFMIFKMSIRNFGGTFL